MRAVLQRVTRARVRVGGETVGETGPGLVVLLGVARDDAERDARYLVEKTVGLRVFDDVEGAGGAPVKHGVKPEPDAEAAVIDTDYGRVVVELYPNVAPKMVERFKTLIKQRS